MRPLLEFVFRLNTWTHHSYLHTRNLDNWTKVDADGVTCSATSIEGVESRPANS
jgi:hypothetical protein